MNDLFTRKYLKEFPLTACIFLPNRFNHFDMFAKVHKKIKRLNAYINLIFWISLRQEYKMILKQVGAAHTSVN